MANKKITDATTATSVAGTDKVFLNQGGDLKQVDLNSAVANSQAVQTLNSNLIKKKVVSIGNVPIDQYDSGFGYYSNLIKVDLPPNSNIICVNFYGSFSAEINVSSINVDSFTLSCAKKVILPPTRNVAIWYI